MKNLQTIRAESMAAALAQVKGRLGDEAVILHTRTVRRGGWLGCGGRDVVEITAAKSSADLSPALRRGMLKRSRGRIQDVEQTLGSNCQGQAEGAAQPVVAVKNPPSDSASPHSAARHVQAEFDELKSVVHHLVRRVGGDATPAVPAELLPTYTTLVQNEVAREIAQDLVTRVRRDLTGDTLRDDRQVRRKLADYVASMIPQTDGLELSDRDRPTVIALVGPTGVGKTTTVAKLAADCSLRRGWKVGLVTLDSSRIAAAEQLRTYAAIIDVPIQVVMGAGDLPAALETMRDRDVVLIDTAGCGSHDEVRLGELKRYLAEVSLHELHLVLSATSNPRVLEQTIEKFADLGINRVILTKLDEAVGFGVMLTCLQKAQARLSYVTTGPAAPHALESGGAQRIAELIVGGSETMELR